MLSLARVCLQYRGNRVKPTGGVLAPGCTACSSSGSSSRTPTGCEYRRSGGGCIQRHNGDTREERRVVLFFIAPLLRRTTYRGLSVHLCPWGHAEKTIAGTPPVLAITASLCPCSSCSVAAAERCTPALLTKIQRQVQCSSIPLGYILTAVDC